MTYLSEVETFEKFIGGHKYRYVLNDYPANSKLEEMIKKHFDEVILFAKKYKYKKVKEIIVSQQHLFRLQLTDGVNLISYDILHDISKGDKTNVAYTIIFNDRQFEYNNLKDAYRQLRTLIETGNSVETGNSAETTKSIATPPSDTKIATNRDASDVKQIVDTQYNSLKNTAEINGYSIKKYKRKESILYFKNPDTGHTIYYQISDKLDTYKIKSVTRDVKPTEKIFRKLYQANKYVTELLTSKKVKGDKIVKTPLIKDVNSEIDKTDKFNKLFDTIVAYKESNDKGYTRLITFLTSELYKNKDIKNIIDLDYNGDTSQIKNIINNHFTKK